MTRVVEMFRRGHNQAIDPSTYGGPMIMTEFGWRPLSVRVDSHAPHDKTWLEEQNIPERSVAPHWHKYISDYLKGGVYVGDTGYQRFLNDLARK